MLAGAACSDDDDPTATATSPSSASSSSGGSGTTSSTSGSSSSTEAAGPEATEDPRADWPDEFILGMFGGDDAEETLETNEPLRLKLEEGLGMPVTIFTGTSYNAVIEAMRADRVDAMVVGPFSYVLAVQEADAEALAVFQGCSTSEDPCVYTEGRPTHYQSVVFTLKGNGIETLDDIIGKGFNFVDPASTSGHLAPKTLLIKRGYDPDVQFETRFAGSHPTSVISVFNGSADAGATNEGNLTRLQDAAEVDVCLWPDGQINIPRTEEYIRQTFEDCPDGHIAILALTDPIPSTPFGIRQELPESFKQAVLDVLLSLKDDPEYVTERRAWFVDPTEDLGLERLDQYYNVLRDIAKLLDLDLAELD
jgi:phosphonate transport system substrate-binding protein